MTRVLQIGKGGQVAIEFARAASAAGFDVEELGRPELDLSDPQAVASALAGAKSFDVLVNCAAYTAVDQAENDAAVAEAVNADSVEAMGRACAECGAAMVHISTDYVFDGSKAEPYEETDPVAPLGVYGETKLKGEQKLLDALARSVILRTAWVYSAHGKNFVKTMLRVGRDRDELAVVDDQHGCPTSAADIADALVAVVKAITEGPDDAALYGVFHYAGAGATTWKRFADEIFLQVRDWPFPSPSVRAIPTSEFPTPARRPANSVLNTAKFEATFGLKMRPWPEALTQVLVQLKNEQA